MICKKCGVEFDPDDFIEDTEMLEALSYFIDIEVLCSECIYEVRDNIERLTRDLA